MIPRRPKAVVFDMDGLLFDTERLYLASVIEAMADHGYVMEPKFYTQMLGQQWPAIRAGILAFYGPSFPVDTVAESWAMRYRQTAASCLTMKAGALELLAFLDELDIPYALATSSDLGAVRRHFEHFSLTGRFRHLVTQEDCEFGKPHPQPYLRAAEALGVSPADCLALEDSHNGIRSATSAGMMAIMVPDLLEPTDEILALCLGAVDDLHHVRRLLTGIPVM